MKTKSSLRHPGQPPSHAFFANINQPSDLAIAHAVDEEVKYFGVQSFVWVSLIEV
ncbi:hypothetical protein GW916_14360 [bacterium]|nr:hypothetical protein [bacterium]